MAAHELGREWRMPRWFPKVAGMGLVVALAACASASAPASKEQQRAQAVARATEYCKKKGLVMHPSKAAAPARSGQASPKLQFHCVKDK